MKPYQAPELTELGSVSSLTSFSFENTTQDTFFGMNGVTITGTGSMDGCVFNPRTGICITGPEAP